MLLFLPIPIPSRAFVVIYAVIELVLGVTGSQGGVAHFAHLGGLVGGAIMLYYWRSRPLRRGEQARTASRLQRVAEVDRSSERRAALTDATPESVASARRLCRKPGGTAPFS